VRKIVEKLTNPDIPRMDSDDEWNRAYAHHVADAIKDDDALAVKLADYFKNAPKLEYTAKEGKVASSARSAAKYLLLIPEFQARIPESKYSRNLGWAVTELDKVKLRLERIIAADKKPT
jgi:(p)ppGpp synthase/HD superfamily hydrolase